MNAPEPSTSLVWQAIEVYLKCAYGEAKLPSAVRERLDTLRACGDAEFFDCPVFELDPGRGTERGPVSGPGRGPVSGPGRGPVSGPGRGPVSGPGRVLLRLGNRFYPHMKLVIERAPTGGGPLFRADTHDRHIRPPPGSREYRAFCELMQANQKIAAEIEAEWARQGVPTFKQYLRHDLERRVGAEPSAPQGPPPAQ